MQVSTCYKSCGLIKEDIIDTDYWISKYAIAYRLQSVHNEWEKVCEQCY